jgi:hypothetical protein
MFIYTHINRPPVSLIYYKKKPLGILYYEGHPSILLHGEQNVTLPQEVTSDILIHTGGDCIRRSFMICAPHQLLLR